MRRLFGFVVLVGVVVLLQASPAAAFIDESNIVEDLDRDGYTPETRDCIRNLKKIKVDERCRGAASNGIGSDVIRLRISKLESSENGQIVTLRLDGIHHCLSFIYPYCTDRLGGEFEASFLYCPLGVDVFPSGANRANKSCHAPPELETVTIQGPPPPPPEVQTRNVQIDVQAPINRRRQVVGVIRFAITRTETATDNGRNTEFTVGSATYQHGVDPGDGYDTNVEYWFVPGNESTLDVRDAGTYNLNTPEGPIDEIGFEVGAVRLDGPFPGREYTADLIETVDEFWPRIVAGRSPKRVIVLKWNRGAGAGPSSPAPVPSQVTRCDNNKKVPVAADKSIRVRGNKLLRVTQPSPVWFGVDNCWNKTKVKAGNYRCDHKILGVPDPKPGKEKNCIFPEVASTRGLCKPRPSGVVKRLYTKGQTIKYIPAFQKLKTVTIHYGNSDCYQRVVKPVKQLGGVRGVKTTCTPRALRVRNYPTKPAKNIGCFITH